MISIINQTFEQNIANNIIRYLEHPTATMIKDHFEEKAMMKMNGKRCMALTVPGDIILHMAGVRQVV